MDKRTTKKRIEELRRIAATVRRMTPLQRQEYFSEVMQVIIWWVDTYGEDWFDRIDGMGDVKELLTLARTAQRRAGLQIIKDWYPGGGQSERPEAWKRHFERRAAHAQR